MAATLLSASPARPLSARSRQRRAPPSLRAARLRPAAVHREAPNSDEATASRLPGATQLDALRSVTRLVIDTGDIDAIAKWKPEDATTNPSLLLKASSSERYKPLALAAVNSRAARTVAPGQGSGARGDMAGAADALAVAVGAEILRLVPGRVSTEADARLAFDTQGTVEHALRLIGLYEEQGISRERVLIKVASTWEGVRAVETLQKQHHICCNCTLLFSFSHATLVSPFVGRILDWHVQHEGRHFAPQEDPGVLAVTRIYDYYKTHEYPTTVMAASFRNADEVRHLVGCDAITLAPSILDTLGAATEPLVRKLSPELAHARCHEPRAPAASTKPDFEAQLGTGMARDKLEEGVAIFARDAAALEAWLAKLKAEGLRA